VEHVIHPDGRPTHSDGGLVEAGATPAQTKND
jgi:hypothetical protein